MLGNSWVVERLLPSQEGLSSMEVVVISSYNSTSALIKMAVASSELFI
jgi:hypothetical protein